MLWFAFGSEHRSAKLRLAASCFGFVLLAGLGAAAGTNVRLYLKDGDYQIVREYEVQGDRVRFYSTERKQWEEIPLDLIDLPRTEKEAADKNAAEAAVLAEEKAEDKAIRADRQLVLSVPAPAGVYRVDGEKLIPLAQGDVLKRDSATNKILQMIAPGPIIATKITVFIEGKTSKTRLTDPNPEFFFRLTQEERLAIVKLDTKKDERVVEVVTVMPTVQGVQGEVFEDQKQVASFKKQYGNVLYRLWPEQPLDPGEYAVLEYTEGKIEVRAWDFTVEKTDKTK